MRFGRGSRRPSTLISSRAGSALVPGAVTVWPLTLTRPWLMSVSAVRREATPRHQAKLARLKAEQEKVRAAAKNRQKRWEAEEAGCCKGHSLPQCRPPVETRHERMEGLRSNT